MLEQSSSLLPHSSKAHAVLLRPLSHLKGFVTTGVHQGVLMFLQHRHLCLSDHIHLHNGSFEPPKRNSSTRKRNTFRGYASSMTDISRFVLISCVDQAHLLTPFCSVPPHSASQDSVQCSVSNRKVCSLTACLGGAPFSPSGLTKLTQSAHDKRQLYHSIAVNQYNYC